MEYLKTSQVAKLLGMREHHLQYLTRQGIVDPGRDGSGDRIWSAEDIDRVREILAQRKRKAETRKATAGV